MSADGGVSPAVEEAPRRSRLKRFGPPGVAVVFVAVTFIFILPRIADYRSVWDAIQGLTWPEVALLSLLTVLNVLTYAPPMMAALPGLRFVPALELTQASTASTYVAPGGAAVGMGISFTMLRAWHFKPADITLAVTLTGIWNQFVVFGAPALALGLLTLKGTQQHGLMLIVGLIGFGVLVTGIAAFVAALSGERLADWVGDRAAFLASWGLRLIRRKPVLWDGRSFVEFRLRAIGLLRRRWWQLTLATLVGQATVFLLMLACLRMLGTSQVEVDGIEAFAAWAVARVIGSLPFMPPGGLGAVELGLTGLLIGFGGDPAEVAAAVLLYRFLTMVPSIVLGSIVSMTWRRHARVVPS